MTPTLRGSSIDDLGATRAKTVLLINPPVQDTRCCAQRAQPCGLLRIDALFRKHG